MSAWQILESVKRNNRLSMRTQWDNHKSSDVPLSLHGSGCDMDRPRLKVEQHDDAAILSREISLWITSEARTT